MRCGEGKLRLLVALSTYSLHFLILFNSLVRWTEFIKYSETFSTVLEYTITTQNSSRNKLEDKDENSSEIKKTQLEGLTHCIHAIMLMVPYEVSTFTVT